ncbi:MAG: STAS/SEC14 domain-containing protein [Acidobacteriota bacterium]|nr:STAS/SEC14 domain-containing protein [Acidobacteriota bacterium]
METAATQISTEQIISAVNQLSLPELDQIFDKVLAVRAERIAPSLPAVESSLLARINQGPPAQLRARMQELKAKRADSSITDAEYEELTQLADQAEVLHADRMTAIGELARLHGLRLPEMMAELGLRFPENG